MKKLLSLLMLGAVPCFSEPLVIEAPIKGYGTPVTIDISSTTLTKVPSSQNTRRHGIFINSPTTHKGVAGFMGNCTSTALASTIRPIQISSTTSPVYISLREDACLWFLALQETTETSSIHYQEVNQ